MSFTKRGTCDSKIVSSSTIYVCSGCGNTEIASSGDSFTKECPLCHATMSLITSENTENT